MLPILAILGGVVGVSLKKAKSKIYRSIHNASPEKKEERLERFRPKFDCS